MDKGFTLISRSLGNGKCDPLPQISFQVVNATNGKKKQFDLWIWSGDELIEIHPNLRIAPPWWIKVWCWIIRKDPYTFVAGDYRIEYPKKNR